MRTSAGEQGLTGASLGEPWARGRRVAEVDHRDGELELRVSLEDEAGAVVLERNVRGRFRGAQAVTLVLARSCRDVRCAPDETCNLGACVSDRCTEETPEACGPRACLDDAQCPPSTGCFTPECTASGRCWALPSDSRCTAGRCDPRTAMCVPPLDAGRPRADAMTPDTGTRDPCTPDRTPLVGFDMRSTWTTALTASGSAALTVRCTQCPTRGDAPPRMTFDGSQWMESDPVRLGLQREITVAAWVRPGAIDRRQTLLGKLYGTVDMNTFQLVIAAGGYPELFAATAARYTYVRSSSTSVSVARWTHLAVVFAPDHVELYIDGVPAARVVRTEPYLEDDGPLFLGADRDSGSVHDAFEGDLRDVYVFAEALPPREIEKLAEAACRPQ